MPRRTRQSRVGGRQGYESLEHALRSQWRAWLTQESGEHTGNDNDRPARDSGRRKRSQ